MYQESQRERNIHKLFLWGVWLKAFDGIAETLGGIILFFPGQLTYVVNVLIRNELLQDSHDALFVYIHDVLPLITGSSGLFIGIYLLIHGLIKVGLVYGLLRNRLWAYPSAIAIFGVFIAYQLAQYVYTHSIFLIILTVLDTILIWLTWHEWQYFKRYHVFAK